MQYIDTHTHIYTDEFLSDRYDVMHRAFDAGAKHLILPNIDGPSALQMIGICLFYPDKCSPMIGIHPTELKGDYASDLDLIEGMLRSSKHPFVGIGEVGIDLHWDQSQREEQIRVFKRQAEWAQRYGLPLMVHCRDAHREVVEVLRPMKDQLTGVFHCFGGTAEEARELLDTFPGFALGIGGILTFKKSTLPAVLRAEVPLSRIVVESDAPYLAPEPHRGTRNEPSYVPLVIQKLAEVYERPLEEVEQVLLDNTYRIFPRIKESKALLLASLAASAVTEPEDSEDSEDSCE